MTTQTNLCDIDYQNHQREIFTLMTEHPLRQLFWECTLRCNLSCLHCGSDCKMAGKLTDMPLEDFLTILDDIASETDARRILVNTVGGEPLMRKDLLQCGIEIKKRGFRWGMVSNGYLLTKNKLNELINAGLDTIAVSLDGFEDTHNWLRGNIRSFERVEIAIGQLVQTKKLTWDVITCVNHRNYHQLNELKDYLISRGVKHWRCTTIFPSGRAANNPDLQLSNEEYKGLMEFIVATRKEGLINLSYSCESYVGEYEGKVRDYLFGCHAGLTVASILADGSISGCLSVRSKYDQGNIYKDNFLDAWNNRFEIYRNPLWKCKDECRECISFLECLGGGMHLRRDDGSLMVCNFKKSQ